MKHVPHLFDRLLIPKIEAFINDFSSSSKKIFLDSNGNLIHPGEFGSYRERVCKDLIRTVIPMRLDIGNGFIFSAKGNVSHQCDLIVYDRNNTPLIETEDKQRFFPIETVVAVGEVKSDISKTALGDALNRLKEIKEIRFDVESPSYIFCRKSGSMPYNPKIMPCHQVFTFLICEKFAFNSDNLHNEIDDLYNNAEAHLRHNMILSIADGTMMYDSDEGRPIHYPVMKQDFKNCMIKSPIQKVSFTEETDIRCNEHEHIIAFLNYLFNGISTTNVLDIDLTHYLGDKRMHITNRQSVLPEGTTVLSENT